MPPTDNNPYVSPGSSASGPSDPPSPPPVLMWFKLYCGAMTLLHALLMVLGGILIVLGPSMAEEEEAAVLAIEGIVFAVMGLPLAALFGVGLFLPQRKWAWIYGIVLIALGMTSACCLPATIPLLIFWIKQEMRVYFNCAA